MPCGDIWGERTEWLANCLKPPKVHIRRYMTISPGHPLPVLPNSATITLATLPNFSLVHTIYLLSVKTWHPVATAPQLGLCPNHTYQTYGERSTPFLVGSGWDKDGTKGRNTLWGLATPTVPYLKAFSWKLVQKFRLASIAPRSAWRVLFIYFLNFL